MISTDAATQWFEQHAAGRALRQAYEDACKFARCMILLFQCDKALQVKATMDDVRYFLDYKGLSPFHKAIRSIMRTGEPEGPSWTQLKQESRKFVQACLQDAIKTAPTSAAAEARLATLSEAIQKAPYDLAPGMCQPLQEGLTQLPKLEKQLRQGRTLPLQTDMYQYTKDVTMKVSFLLATHFHVNVGSEV